MRATISCFVASVLVCFDGSSGVATKQRIRHYRGGEAGAFFDKSFFWVKPSLDRTAEIIVAMLRQRLHMRNEQFNYPVSEDRIRAIERGDVEPLEFDLASEG